MKLRPIHRRLNVRIGGGLMAALLVVGIPFFVFFYRFHQEQLIEGLRRSSADVSQLILMNLERRMVEAQPHLLDEDVQQLSTYAGIERIAILNASGEVKVTSDRELDGRIFTLREPSCRICHDEQSPMPWQTTIIDESERGRVFRSLMLIANRPACFDCHSSSHHLNGILLVDLSMAQAQSQLRSGMQKMLGLAAVMVVVTIGVLGGLINRLVVRRINRLWRTMMVIRQGNLGERAEVDGRDEIGELAENFNRMTARLAESVREIQRHKEYLESVINSIEDEIVVVDRDLRIVTANTAYLLKCGRRKEDILGEACFLVSQDSFVPCNASLTQRCPAQATFETGRVNKVLHRFLSSDGQERYIEIYCYPLRDEAGEVFQAIEVKRDITERRSLQAHLSHSERLAMLGLLASGISHEINNPLASIIACTEGIQRRLVARPPHAAAMTAEEFREYLELIHKEAMRAKAITDRLLILSRRSQSPTDLVSPNQSLSETVSLLRFQAEERGIEIIEELDPRVPHIRADDPGLRQVFLNLLLNALQAIEGPGRIRVRTSAEPESVVISIEDTGCGITPEDLPRIFEPFFSRKTRRGGTGLGLFISKVLVEQMGGTITAQSQPGEGSRFVIRFPLEGTADA
jgi:PAS domain S-box-containing protein